MLHLELHLGMSGRLFLAAPDYPTAKHDHFILRTRELSLVYSDYRQFGRVFLHPPVADPWSALPFEVLDRRFTLTYLNRVTSRRGGTSLKALLLDQAIFPGVGNWMADEICWRLPCHPAKKLRDLELGLVRKVSRQICRGAMRHVADKNSPRGWLRGILPGALRRAGPPAQLALPTPLEGWWSLPSLPLWLGSGNGRHPHHSVVPLLPGGSLEGT